MSELSKKVVEYLGYPGLCLDQDRAEKLELAQEVEALAKRLSDVQESLTEAKAEVEHLGAEIEWLKNWLTAYRDAAAIALEYDHRVDAWYEKGKALKEVHAAFPPLPQPPKPEEKPLCQTCGEITNGEPMCNDCFGAAYNAERGLTEGDHDQP